MDSAPIPPPISFALHQAYSGSQPGAPVRVAYGADARSGVQTPGGSIVSPVIADRVELSAPLGAARKLVAGTVPGKADFSPGPAGARADGVIPMYRHPADRNAAATGVSVGRSLDISG